MKPWLCIICKYVLLLYFAPHFSCDRCLLFIHKNKTTVWHIIYESHQQYDIYKVLIYGAIAVLEEEYYLLWVHFRDRHGSSLSHEHRHHWSPAVLGCCRRTAAHLGSRSLALAAFAARKTFQVDPGTTCSTGTLRHLVWWRCTPPAPQKTGLCWT